MLIEKLLNPSDMLFANNDNGEKIEAEPEAIGICPSCAEKLLAKCGPLKIWHWSHKGKNDCDDWYEPETEWHLGWKKLFGKENCEVVIPPHRADILGNYDVVLELQHSAISIQQIDDRERFYKKMIWVVDAHNFAENLMFFKNKKKMWRKLWSLDGIKWTLTDCEYALYWKYKQKRWLPMYGAQMPVMLDLSQRNVNIRNGETFSNSLFWLQTAYVKSEKDMSPYSFGGRFISKQRIIERYKPLVKNRSLDQPQTLH